MSNNSIKKATHTPGPWKAHKDIRHSRNTGLLTKDSLKNYAIYGEKGRIAIMTEALKGCMSEEEIAANARLIAAAPNLLEELQGLHGALSRMIDKHDPDNIEAEWLSHSHEAIIKATDPNYFIK